MRLYYTKQREAVLSVLKEEPFKCVGRVREADSGLHFILEDVYKRQDYTYKYMEAVGLKFKEGRPLTKDFMHIMNTALFESFFEVVRHNMSKEEAMEYIDLLEKYHSAGWSVIYDECK